jgi:hypothetical protein
LKRSVKENALFATGFWRMKTYSALIMIRKPVFAAIIAGLNG